MSLSIPINIYIFKNGLIHIDVIKTDLINIDIDILKKCLYINNTSKTDVAPSVLQVGGWMDGWMDGLDISGWGEV